LHHKENNHASDLSGAPSLSLSHPFSPADLMREGAAASVCFVSRCQLGIIIIGHERSR
jgi:hypothetical protein